MQIPAVQHEAGELSLFVVELGHGSVTRVESKLPEDQRQRSGDNRPCLGDQISTGVIR